MRSLLTIGNPKTLKGQRKGYITAVLHLAPANAAGMGTVCPSATAGCIAMCLNTAGRGGIFAHGASTNAIQDARKRRTRHYKLYRAGFEVALAQDIVKFKRMANRKGLIPCVRVNGTSDLPGLAHNMARLFPDVQFYDYTKLPYAWERALPNYHLTFSRSERNADEVLTALAHGMNVAVVFSTPKSKSLPKWAYAGGKRYAVIDGDEHDLRFVDPQGVIVGLRAKGRARKDTSGFVVRILSEYDCVLPGC